MKYRVTLAYDGTDYFGWQAQLEHPTIQRVFESALEKLEGAPVTAFAAGRTDAGVHAEGQVASFHLSRKWEGRELLRALNGNLPFDIRVLDASAALDDFHARYDAKSKTYRYRIYLADVMNPLMHRFAWHYPYQRSMASMDGMIEESRALLGTHDYSAFTIAGCEAKSKIRTITDIRFERDDNLLTIYFSGDGFLRYQIRTMIGALFESSGGRLKAGSIARLLESRERNLAGVSAPAKGLTLMKVEY